MDIVNLWDKFQWIAPYLKVILAVILAFMVIGFINRILKRYIAKTVLPIDAQFFLRKWIVYFLWFSVLMYIMAELKLQELLVPLLGASFLVGAAVALAVKDILADAMAGIFLLADKHFDIGDQIETMNHKGEIISVSLRKTRIKIADNKIVILPNGKIDSSGWVLNEKRKVV
ncbi:MAG TPA: mechanosensitive ion channel domain-containing protein [Candidatus Nanoarchaeia archaeon]|nr:mechanosensitive ion channel domain-containing protein [Candidatus Nanoarchaeia archaeon]